MKKNAYLQKQKVTIDAYRQAEKETTMQYMIDTLLLVLHNPEVMGKDTFGLKRIRRLMAAWSIEIQRYEQVFHRVDEQDYWQVKLDQQLKEILGDEFVPFSKRYEWLREAK